MCGLAAMVGLGGRQADAAVLEAMSEVLTHRGPDDKGLYVDGPVGFGFRRLAILDLAPTGHQPMISADGHLVLIFNGEIYNYVELRGELEARGHRFSSSGDTQVLLAAYRQWGRDCLQKLNGMWAFLIYDRHQGKLFGSRDRFGVKPLYRFRAADCIYFASEIKAIVAAGDCGGEPNWRQVSQFLLDPRLDMRDSGAETFYAGVEQVPPGSAFELGLDGRVDAWRFWSLDEVVEAAVTNPPAAFGELFEDAVRLRMRSDVPVGVSLSGGLDSTSIISVMARLRERHEAAAPDAGLQAFSYVSPDFDESAYIAETVDLTRAIFHPVGIDPLRLWDNLDRVLWYQDEPVHSLNELISFDICALAASNGIKVMLNGGGADETIAGYSSFFPLYWRALCRAGRFDRAREEIESYCRVHGGDPVALHQRARREATRARLAFIPGYRLAARLWRRLRARRSTWFTREVTPALPGETGGAFGDPLAAALRAAVERAPLPYYLRVDDRNSMAHSLEIRSPFLDYRVVSLAFGVSAEWKLRGPWNKYLLREGMRDRIPEIVRVRPDKMGFPVPVRQWVAGPLYERLQDLLASRRTATRGLYNIAAIRRDLERHRAGQCDVSSDVLAVAQVERWLALGNGRRQPQRA
jgi:asparagine synthase (glutamine-hydrolysing)